MKRVAIIGSVAAMIAAFGVSAALPADAQFRPALQESRATADEAKASQQRIDDLDDQTAELLNQFRADQRQLDASRRYNRTLQSAVDGQERQIIRLQEDISNVASLQQAVEPLMGDMVSAFEKFVAADMPFNLEGPTGRLRRAERLREVLDDPEQAAAQKYRTIIEAYKLENEFGRTINYYEGSIDIDGTLTSGEYLQIGRVELIFKTADNSVLKAWNNQTKTWDDLPRSHLPDIAIASRIAQQQAAPNLFAFPIKRLSTAQ